VQIADHRRLGGGASPRLAQQRLIDPPASKQRLGLREAHWDFGCRADNSIRHIA